MNEAETHFRTGSLAGLRRAFAEGLSPSDLVCRIDAAIETGGRDEAWIHRLSLDALLERAADLERLRDASSPSTPLPPLWGIPFAVKDNIDAAGLPTTAACPAFAYIPDQSAPVVGRLLDAGAILLGKTNMDQFATGLVGVRTPYGACRNLFNGNFIAGGSSSGSAMAVTAGWAVFALGTDTAGSGRVPAAFGGIVGLKPSRGLLSTQGVVPACRSLDCVSIFAARCDDALEIAKIAAETDIEDSSNQDAAFCFGVPVSADLDFDDDSGARKLYWDAVARLEAIGGRRIEFDFAPFRGAAQLLYGGPFVAERYAAVGAFIESNPDAVDPIVREIILGGKRFTAEDLARARETLENFKKLAGPVWRAVDCIALPTTPTIYTIEEIRADPIGKNSKLGIYTNFVNLMDLCAIAVPAGRRPQDGLPLGISLIAPAGCDAKLCRLGSRFLDENAAAEGNPQADRGARGGLPGIPAKA